MDILLLLAAWMVISALVALTGSEKKIGYGLTFLICVLLSPLVGLIVGLSSPKTNEPKMKMNYKCKHCELVSKENSHYCPRCFKDSDGFTAEENRERFSKPKTVVTILLFAVIGVCFASCKKSREIPPKPYLRATYENPRDTFYYSFK